ncbi:MAG: hypothetical protein LCH39_04435 [Proteobacteria bacterium]|nr:hypothetical protein [Pseudomonadota bacterium]
MPNSYDPARNPSASYARSAGDPAGSAIDIVPNDAANLTSYVKALRIYVPATLAEATVRVTPTLAEDDASFVTLRFPAGVSYEPLSVRRVWATGTTPEAELHGYLS